MAEGKRCKLLAFPENPALATSIRAKAIVFTSQESHAFLDYVERVGASQAPVLIEGETGTGKELIARHLHASSKRTGPFLAVNCGGFSENLVEAELFGHEAGAFTGAQGARPGWFEAADGGTLFLDEIGDLPLAMQVKLLRILQEQEVTRLGSRKARAVDVRVVTATNVDLEKAVAAGRFRMDLFYRINVARVRLPPLRERLDDLRPLVKHFLRYYTGKLGIAELPAVSEEAWQALRAYSWPGNIRELENVLHFALLVSRGEELTPDDLRLSSVSASPAAAPSATPQQQLTRALERLLADGTGNLYEEVEEILTRWAFEKNDSNQVRTAKALGVSRNTLRTLLKRHQLLVN